MPKKYPGFPPPKRVREGKVAMSYRLSPSRIEEARRILGAPTATATIEEALDAVVFRHELMDGAARAFGIDIGTAFPDPPAGRRKRR
ncbi:MAG TPA: hypothetical protein VE967_16350 [Gemmatimonadaceae bacterium]|nr:hypothetical protein [Gemmatimonadaceae bacterium]